MKRLTPILLALLLLPAFPIAQGEEADWVEARAVPAWVLAPPRREGYVRIVDVGRSNLLRLAYGFLDKVTLRAVQQTIAWRLRPLLGVDADKAAAASVAKPALVKQAYHVNAARKGRERTLGGSTTIAWVLWEVPAAPILAAVPADKRKAATTALHRAEPAGCPAWTETAEAPPWVEAPKEREEHLSIVVMERARRQDVARANASVFGGSRVGGHVAGRLRKLLGGKDAWAAGYAAARWRIPRARASRTLPGDTKAWVQWDVPLDHVLAAVSEPQRQEARRLLLAP